MTHTAQKLIRELERLPADEQEKRAASYLDDLRQHAEEPDADAEPYAALKLMRDAELEGLEDASVTYEKALYGPYSESHD